MSALRETYRPLLDAGYFSHIDIHFAEEVIRREGKEDELLYLAALSVSRCAGEKHVCLDLERIPAAELPEGMDPSLVPVYPGASSWISCLSKCATVGGPGSDTPLILDGTKLYLHKYHRYETGLAGALLERSKVLPFDRDAVRPALDSLFEDHTGLDWQRCAAMNAAVRNFSVVTGGPGTGKTTTAARIVLLLIREAMTRKAPCRIALCAPTGKAAAHLHASLRRAVEETAKLSEKAKALVAESMAYLPQRSHTIHRLLGSIPGSPLFRHNRENPLPYDIVIVDEMSMADLALSAKLVDAVRTEARLVFLGDMDQLSSVEAGSVMGDICIPRGAPYDRLFASHVRDLAGADLASTQVGASGGIRGAIVYLTESHRFKSDSAIGRIAALVRDGNGKEAIASIGADPSVSWKEYRTPAGSSDERREKECSGIIAEAAGLDSPGSPFYRWSSKGSHEEFFDALSKLQILCALRNGVFGSVSCARLVESLLVQRGFLEGGRSFRHGQTVMITRNDHSLRLYNGDVGVICRSDAGLLRAYFRDHETGTYRSLSPYQLPPHESSLSLTVHKSQGSEYSKVVMILPDSDSPVVTRELIYTGITRARECCVIAGKAELFAPAVERRTERTSALGSRLWI